MNKQEREFYRTFSEHGSGDAKVSIAPKEVLVLLYIWQESARVLT